ncbi:MAG TPA: hypothetical protein VNM69_19840 [Bacillus sp. (in: firmicutes)]|uniref:GNAT family N-acetyltransferase n=1 Tax=Bacillus litorisediminis TaxID=2922713 RepID=UPI001FAD98F6|nr:hypothetical protein [Bacillus litorisediminis]HWO78125.1 hypothetical protein [Bacillus sp. (in: firmicutes)]
MGYESRLATKDEVGFLKIFLQNAGLSTEGVDQLFEYFILLENDQKEWVGCLGIEPLGTVGLMRSFVVMPNVEEEGIFLLFEKMLQLAQEKNVRQILLATNRMSSIPFLSALGFTAVDKADLPSELSQSAHGKQLLQTQNVTFMQR